MAQRPLGSAVLLTILCAAFVSGCCPSGPKVLEGLTLPVEEQAGCSLVDGTQVTDGPLVPMAANPLSTSDSRKVSAIAPLVTGTGAGDEVVGGVRSAYAAVYECEPGGPLVRVYAVLFSVPTGSARAALLEANPGGVMYKGQLAGVVLADEDACESCYDAVMTRAEMVLGK
jgi:hypothetical protein